MRPPLTTPRRRKRLKDYCIKRRGNNPYDLDCHKFVNCWDSTALLQTCHPANLVFDPVSGRCKWSWEPGMAERCQSVRRPAPTTPRPRLTTRRPNFSTPRPQQKTNFNSPNCASFQHLGKSQSVYLIKISDDFLHILI